MKFEQSLKKLHISKFHILRKGLTEVAGCVNCLFYYTVLTVKVM